MISELLYVYGLIPANELDPDGELSFQTKRHGDILAVFDAVDPDVFSQEMIDKHADDPSWVKEKAVVHHSMLAMLRQRCTVIPLKFCTIFEGERSLEAMLSQYEVEITALFTTLKGKEEWNLKVYGDKEKLKSHVMQSSNETEAELSGLSPGKQFLMRKQMNARLEVQFDNEMKRICLAMHESLSKEAVEKSVKKVWDRKVTGRKEDMIWNSVYLMDRQKVDCFLQLVNHYNDEYQAAGLAFEATGPWPVYHFARLHSENA
ncbi:GvpL/GvpF family gas vesicle protein [Paenibacillus silvisoli]|uniref:GvpL/GvpF family gas vesicle protein n=1 Tax=Paenibacillus silvisoli TaxID=3110539 RepID=UPI002804F0DC|nr:GvpL/GvpF family gas vesicle protein [Paenibacillus silvisoli]